MMHRINSFNMNPSACENSNLYFLFRLPHAHQKSAILNKTQIPNSQSFSYSENLD